MIDSHTIRMSPYLLLLVVCGILNKVSGQFEPTWDSLDARVIPDWYDKAKVGIFVHWGVYSVIGVDDAWFWWDWQGDQNPDNVRFMQENYPPSWTYQDFANEFTAEFYDPAQWAELFANSGAKYVVLTSKHHDGFALWPSKYAYSWNANDVGPHRDVLGELAEAIRAKDLHFGLYHSLYEWFHPLYQDDKANNWATSNFVDSKIIPEMKELVNTYKPEIVWSDGNWEASDTYWKSLEFLAWLYNESPVKDVVLVNDRWGSNTQCAHGDFYTCADRYNPGYLLPHKWENCMTIDIYSWGYRRNQQINEILSTHDLIVTLAQTVSCGGNILINVGPTKEGTIIPIFQERLLDLGTWLSINGDGIYESNAWTFQNDGVSPGVWYTTKEPTVYAIVLDWPQDNTLGLSAVNSLFERASDVEVTLLGNEDQLLTWERRPGQINISFPDKATVASKWAWVLKITPVE